ncbi:LysM peptidoglycan-binding and 3D domain-containing protein [Brochothrix thermosphacta]|uniref:Exported cell wall lytic enzyme n=1 Tax=Brochothrix thermosphacta TaxID=2756 RepID=A0A2X0S8W3_BROTH|nr:LysM peptidoglycan-binding domain-containing protein [Brochothrix thermosphacta]SPP29072.1 exported cell wall lytic enzyme [Brochothrix thermosphacta]
MNIKKLTATVVAGLTLATVTFSATGVSANSYTVKSGDSLWKIANEKNISIDELKSLNKLSSDVIQTNQTLQLSKTDATYTVKTGDSIWKIATKKQVTEQNLKSWNNLSTDIIFPGQVLKLTGSDVPVAQEAASKATEAAPQATTPKAEQTTPKVEKTAPTTPAAAPKAEQAAPKAAAPKVEASNNSASGRQITVQATAYDAVSLGGRTASGHLVTSTSEKVIAVDPSVIPLGSTVYIPGYGTAVARDTGGAIQGNIIDLNMSTAEAVQWGRQTVTVTVK